VRLLTDRPGLRLVAIEEPAAPRSVEYLLRFDTLLGHFPKPLRLVDEDRLEVNGRAVRLFPPIPGETPDWAALGVSVVVEASGRLHGRADLERHLAAGAHRVVLCSPPSEPPDLTLVAGVNDELLDDSKRIVSVGSVTANCIGPVLKVLVAELGVERAFLASVHAYGNQLRLADVPAPDMRSGRAAAENIIPQPTNADEVLSELLPELAGRVSGLAVHVPVPNGSVVDLTCWHPREVTVEEVNDVIRAAAAGDLRSILGFEDQPIVSSDILMTKHSGVFDSLSTMVVAGRVSKTLTFYDNGWGYSHRVIELLERFASMETAETRS